MCFGGVWVSGLSHPATTGKEGVKRDAPGARALFQAAGSLGTIRKALGTLSLVSTQPPAVSASGLKAVKRGGRRGTFPSGTPDFGSGARGNEKRDVAKHAKLAVGVRGGGVGRRLEPSSRQKLREPAKWVRTVSGKRQGRWVAACHHVCCPGCCRLLGQMGVMDLGKIPFQNSPGQDPGSSPSLIPLLLMPAPHTPANEAPFNSLTLMRSNHFYPSIRKRL